MVLKAIKNYHVGNSKLYQDIRVKCFEIAKTTVYNVVTKSNFNKLAKFLKEAGSFLSSTSNQTKPQ